METGVYVVMTCSVSPLLDLMPKKENNTKKSLTKPLVHEITI